MNLPAISESFMIVPTCACLKRSGLAAALRHAPIAFVVVISLWANPALTQTAEAQVATEVKVPTVTVATVAVAEVVGQVAVSGTLVARDEILIFPQVNGFTIESLTARVGDRVSAGDVMATLATRNLSVQVQQAQAEVSRAEAGVRQAGSQINTAKATLTQGTAQLTRAQELVDRGVGTQASLDDATAVAGTARAAAASATDGLAVAQAQLEQAQAQLDLANLDLDHARITAPLGGVVSARNGQIGAIAASGGEPIFRIIAGGAVDAELEVIESALGAIAIGNPVILDIASVGAVLGEVSRISPTVDPVNRLATVTVEVSGNAALRPGLFANGTIETVRRDSLSTPTTAILDDSNGSFALRVEDGEVERRPVIAGLIWKGRREVLGGLEEGDTVIARAGAFFTDGDIVNTVTTEAAPQPGTTKTADATEETEK